MKYFIYFSYLGGLFATAAFYFMLLNHYTIRKPESKLHEFAYKAGTIVVTMAMSFQALITIIYWLVIFPAYEFKQPFHSLNVNNMYILHIAPVMLIYIDFAINRYKFKFEHSLINQIFALTYTFFNIVYVKIGDVKIYEILSWDDVASVVWTWAASMIIFGTHCGLYAITKKRLSKSENVKPAEPAENIDQTPSL